MPHKEFGSTTRPAEPVEFTAAGERFHCVAVIPAALTLDLMAVDEVPKVQGAAIISFLKEVLVAEDVPRFEALLASKERTVDMATLAEVMQWLLEEAYATPSPLPPMVEVPAAAASVPAAV